MHVTAIALHVPGNEITVEVVLLRRFESPGDTNWLAVEVLSAPNRPGYQQAKDELTRF